MSGINRGKKTRHFLLFDKMKLNAAKIRSWCRTWHRDLSFVFAGMFIVYALSGIAMNHRDSFNPNYSVKRSELKVDKSLFSQGKAGKEQVLRILEPIGESRNFTQFYYPEPNQLRIFLKGGSSVVIDMENGTGVYEKLSRRPIFSFVTKLHYNPGRLWTYFADAFGIAMLLITITGLAMLKGKNGLWGKGGIEFGIGILIPVIILLVM